LGGVSTFIIAALIIGPGLFFLARAIKREAVDGKCAGCSHKDGCGTCASSSIVNFKSPDGK
jgi:hypothetical protein